MSPTSNRNRNSGADAVYGVDAAVDGVQIGEHTTDATLNWNGGEHEVYPGGPGDTPFTPETANIAGTEGHAPSPQPVRSTGVRAIDAVADFWIRG